MAQQWINSGKVEKVKRPTPAPKTIPLLPLNEAIARVCGKNVHQLEWCFLTAEKDPEKWQMRFEDFLRNLTEGMKTRHIILHCVATHIQLLVTSYHLHFVVHTSTIMYALLHLTHLLSLSVCSVCLLQVD